MVDKKTAIVTGASQAMWVGKNAPEKLNCATLQTPACTQV